MRKLFVACLAVLGFANAMAAAPEHLLPENFLGSYLANRSTPACLLRQQAGGSLPAYLVIQARNFRYGYTNPQADNSLDAMVCRATEPVVVAGDSMEVRSECFLTDQLVKRHFRFTKRAGVLWMRDLERQTEEEFEVCYH